MVENHIFSLRPTWKITIFVYWQKNANKSKKNKDLEKSHTVAIFDKKSNFEVLKKILQGLMQLTKLLMIYFKKSFKKARFVLVSDSVSYEMDTKVFITKTPIIAAVSACSS